MRQCQDPFKDRTISKLIIAVAPIANTAAEAFIIAFAQ
jgi:hypothetical protein